MDNLTKSIRAIMANRSDINTWIGLGSTLDNAFQTNFIQKTLEEALSAHMLVTSFLCSDVLTSDNCMTRIGEYWAVRFGREIKLFQDSDGINYVASLIKYADEDIHTGRLFKERKPLETIKYENIGQSVEEEDALNTRYSPDSYEEVADKKYRADLRLMEDDYREAIEVHRLNSEIEKAAELQEKLDQLMKVKSATFGRRGNSRAFVNTPDRIRRTVYNAITREMAKFKIHLPELWKHLKENKRLRTGIFCRYISTTNINWSINL